MRSSEALQGGLERVTYFQVQFSDPCLKPRTNVGQKHKLGCVLGPVMVPLLSPGHSSSQYMRLLI